MLEENTTFFLLLVEKIGSRDCSAYILCVSPSFAGLKSCRLIQVESASRRGPEDHAGRISPSSPTSLTVCTRQWSKRFILWTHKPTSDTAALWYRYFCCCNLQQVHSAIQEADEHNNSVCILLFWVKWYRHYSIIASRVVQWCHPDKDWLVVNRVFGISLHYSAIFFARSQQLEEIRKLLEEISQAETCCCKELFTSQLHVDSLFLPMLLEAKAKETIPVVETVAEIIEAPAIPSAQPLQRSL